MSASESPTIRHSRGAASSPLSAANSTSGAGFEGMNDRYRLIVSPFSALVNVREPPSSLRHFPLPSRPLPPIELHEPFEPRNPSDRCADQGQQRLENLLPKPEVCACDGLAFLARRRIALEGHRRS